MRVAALLLLIACEKSGPVESSSGSAGATPFVVQQKAIVDARIADAGIATLARDAAPIAAATPDAVDLDDEAMAFANKLTSEDPNGSSGEMSSRRPGRDLAADIDAVKNSGKTVVIGGGGGGTRNGPPTASRGPSGRVSIVRKQAFDDTTLTADQVLAKIQAAYMLGIKRCYKRYLDKDPTARGRISLSITVSEAGQSGPKARGFAAEIDDCLKSQMAAWRFPIPRDKDREPMEANFEIVLHLVPN